MGRVNHAAPQDAFIPPLAQAAFALAHWIGPWSLDGLAVDLFGSVMPPRSHSMVALLRETGRSPLWSALYWWNPLAIKEIVNSAHLDILLLPLILAGLLLVMRNRYAAATACMVAAAGIKLWPALLLPFVWRPLANQPAKLAGLATASLAVAALMAWPVLAGGLSETSGYVAYAKHWTTNSALFPRVQSLIAWLLQGLGWDSAEPAFVARALAGFSVLAFILWLARRPIARTDELLQRVALAIVALFLLMPAQFPWYYLWLTPFTVFLPLAGVLVLTATLPLYYASFHFIARDTAEVFSNGLVWLVWLPAWALLIFYDGPRLLRLSALREA